MAHPQKSPFTKNFLAKRGAPPKPCFESITLLLGAKNAIGDIFGLSLLGKCLGKVEIIGPEIQGRSYHIKKGKPCLQKDTKQD